MGWRIFKEDAGNFILIALIGLALSAAGSFVVSGPIHAGFFLVARRRMLEQRTDLNDLFAGFGRFVDAFLAHVVTSVFLIVALVFCFVPVFIVAALYLFTYLFMVDRQMAFWDAMEASRRLVMQNLVGYTLFALLLMLLNFLGLMLAVVGLLVTVPVSVAAVCVAYSEKAGFAHKPVESHGPIRIP
jgi:uncharacterized membrane protein